MADQVDLHPALAEVVELDFEPVHLERAGVRGTIAAAVDSWVTSATRCLT